MSEKVRVNVTLPIYITTVLDAENFEWFVARSPAFPQLQVIGRNFDDLNGKLAHEVQDAIDYSCAQGHYVFREIERQHERQRELAARQGGIK